MTTLLLLFQLIFSSHDLECYRLSDRVVWYVSYAEMKGFGRVASNGLFYLTHPSTMRSQRTSWIG